MGPLTRGARGKVPIRHIMPDRGFVNFADRIPLYVSGFGPKSLGLAGRFGDGVVMRIDGSGVREFVAILKLHRDHPAEMVDRAVKQALDLGAAHLDGVQLCLRQILSPQESPPTLVLNHPKLAAVGYQPVRLEQYNQLLEARS